MDLIPTPGTPLAFGDSLPPLDLRQDPGPRRLQGGQYQPKFFDSPPGHPSKPAIRGAMPMILPAPLKGSAAALAPDGLGHSIRSPGGAPEAL